MDKNPFKTKFSRDIFFNKYAHSKDDTWYDLAVRLVDDVCGTMGGTKEPLLDQDTRKELVNDIFAMKFIPGGRYLYYAGRPLHAWNNCLTGDHKLLTDKGMVRLDSLENGSTVNVYSPVSKQFEAATAVSHGVQPVQEITFAPVRGRSKKVWKVKATPGHHWPLKGGGDTYGIKVGDVVPASVVDIPGSEAGWIHGVVFADSSQQQKSGSYYYQFRLCGEKAKYASRLEAFGFTITYPPFAKGDPVGYLKSDIDMKSIPVDASVDYLVGFIRGWVDLDGHNNLTRQIHTIDKAAIDLFIDNAHLAGFIVSGELRVETKPSNFGPRKPLYHVNFKDADSFHGFKVVAIEQLGDQEVFCPFEPLYNRITIDHGIDTFQCFLLRAEEDTREEWGAVIKRSSDCLMLGGGIGIDYSRLRCRNTPLRRTGGKASGPVPLMNSVNEYGRNVMQGGSRRSANYASLSWRHGDAIEFMVSKNWHDMPVGSAKKSNGKPYTIADAKQDDFNFRAPLDMTNISLNYDDTFLDQVNSGYLPDLFIQNCRQALSTGEPGFSFNFGDKSNETLRNACVTGDTVVLTDGGYKRIDSLVGKSVSVWNGSEWSVVQPKVTGTNQRVFTIGFSCGSSITCTDYHEFIVPIGYTGDFHRVKASDLKVGTKIKKFKYPVIQSGECKDEKEAYTQGFVSGDGMDNYNWLWLYSPKFMCLDRLALDTVWSPNNDDRRRVNLSFKPKLKSFVPHSWDVRSRCLWLAGLCDSDGCLLNEGGIQIGSIDKTFLGEVQLMLTTMGVSSKVVLRNDPGMRMMPDGHGGLREYMCQQSYCLCISAQDVQLLRDLGFVTSRIELDGYAPNRNASRFPTVVSIEYSGMANEVYCFNEPKRHMGCFNGIITGQCTEVTSEDDSDVCNLGSVNLGNIDSICELSDVCRRASMFLVCGTLRADLPYRKVHLVREKNRRLGLGLMGIHEWLLKRSMPYEVGGELSSWLKCYQENSEVSAKGLCDKMSISRPVAYRAIAPTGSIGILAATTTGIEPLFAVAFKRRYLTDGTKWKYQYVVDATADRIIQETGVDPDSVETAASLASDFERRIKFQYDIQKYVDMSISSTINLPKWGSELNNEDKVCDFAKTLAKYAHGLRGFTCYPDGARGGQPLTPVKYKDAKRHDGVVFDEVDICEWSGKGGTCGV